MPDRGVYNQDERVRALENRSRDLEDRMTVLETQRTYDNAILLDMRGKVDRILEAATQARGGWRMLLILGSISTGVAGAVGWVLHTLHLIPPTP